MSNAALTSFALLAAPVVDIDGTFFVQGGLFIALVLVLKPLLFNPWLAALARRDESTSGAVAQAKQLRLDADRLGLEYDQRLDETRDRAAELRSQARREEETLQNQRLAAARSEAATELDAARRRHAEEAAQARTALGGRIDDLAEDIATKILGRTGR